MSIPDGVHDLGCHCWPHVSVREVQARTAERDAALARAERAEAAVATLRERVGHDDDCDAGLDDANECTCPSGPVLSDTEAAATATIERIRQAERERIAEAVMAADTIDGRIDRAAVLALVQPEASDAE